MRLSFCVAASMTLLLGSGSISHTQPPTTLPQPLSASETPNTGWRLVNEAHLIVRVHVSRAKEKVVKDPADPEGYRIRRVLVLDVLKGAALLPAQPARPNDASQMKGAVLDLLGYPSQPEWRDLRRHQGKDTILFLHSSNNESASPSWYLLPWGPLAVQIYSSALEGALRAEIQHQGTLTASVRSMLNARVFPHEDRVRLLVDRLLDPKTYMRVESPATLDDEPPPPPPPIPHSSPEPLAELEQLGEEAIPAIVKVMDDRRLLPGGSVSIGLDISKRPRAFEGIYHTSASQVVDVLCMALDQITQGGFGTVSSGSPKWQRDRAVEGWQLYLGHTSRWRQALAGDTLPILASDPPKDLLGTFKVNPFQKVDRLEGLPEPVQEAIHEVFKKKCDALHERMTRGSRVEMEKDPDWAAMSEQEKEDFFVFDTPGIANPGEKWTAGDAIPRSMLHRPRRRLIFGGTSPSLWFMYYEHGGIGRHQHLLVIGKGDAGGYWLRWVRNSHLGEKGIGMTRLKSLAARGRLATSEEDTVD